MAESNEISVRKSELLYQLGLLLAPIENGVLASEEGLSSSYSIARAKYVHDFPQCEMQYRDFFINTIPGHSFSVELNKWGAAVGQFRHTLERNIEFSIEVKQALDEFKKSTFDIVCSIPNDLEGQIVGKNSPYSAFIILRSLFETARLRVAVIDPYLDDTIFYRYLNHVGQNVEVTIATEMKNLKATEVAFLDCSRLLAQERGPGKYTLIDTEMHDRWLIIDDEIYHSGASLKDAAKNDPFTLAKLEDTTKVNDEIHTLLSNGTVKYGPSCTIHP